MNIGITGHQSFDEESRRKLRRALLHRLEGVAGLMGVSSLAAGADQLFVDCVWECGGDVLAVIPCEGYEHTFAGSEDLAAYRIRLERAAKVIVLDHDSPSDEAFWQAGQEVVRRSDLLLAVWDGKPSAGTGGTADVVSFARGRGVRTEVVWPSGTRRV